MTNPKSTAFPSKYDSCNQTVGLSKREWFAGLALQGLLAGNYTPIRSEEYAIAAVRAADSLIAALNEDGGS